MTISRGDIFNAFICHVVDDETFYLVRTVAAFVLDNIEKELANMEISKMFWYPQVNEKFLLRLNEEYHRARRVADIVSNSPFAASTNIPLIRVELIDVGAVISIPVTRNSDAIDVFWIMPEKYKKIQPLAIKCKWDDTDNDIMKRDQITLFKHNDIKKLLTFEAVRLKNDLIYVQLWQYHEREFDNRLDECEIKTNSLDRLIPQDESDSLPNSGERTVTIQKYLEPNNQETAVCFMDSTRNMMHSPQTLERNENRQEMLNAKEEINKIMVGKAYEIKIYAFIGPNRIICCVDSDRWDEQFAKIQRAINLKNDVKRFKKLQNEPNIYQLVLVKTDNRFYRGKVLSARSEGFLIYLMDLGCLDISSLQYLYEWTQIDNDYLTHEMEIENIVSIDGKRKRAELEICNQENVNGPLHAKIT